MSFQYLVEHEEQLSDIIKKLAPKISNEQIIFIEGDVGSGKTTFTRYLIEAIAGLNNLEFFFQGSPTYQRENHYHLKQVNLVHFDFYLVDNNSNIDLEDYVRNHCLIVEWPLEFLKKRYQEEALFIKIYFKNNSRIINIDTKNLKWLQKIQ